MTLDLYGTLASAPCRSVLLTAKAIGVTLNIVETVPLSEAIKSPEFIKVHIFIKNCCSNS